MIMVDRQRQLANPLHVGRGGRIALAVVLAAIVAGLIVLFTASSSPRHGCIEVVFASTLGAARLEKCGRQAQELCAHPERVSSLTAQIDEACRRSGISR